MKNLHTARYFAFFVAFRMIAQGVGVLFDRISSKFTVQLQRTGFVDSNHGRDKKSLQCDRATRLLKSYQRQWTSPERRFAMAFPIIMCGVELTAGEGTIGLFAEIKAI